MDYFDNKGYIEILCERIPEIENPKNIISQNNNRIKM